MVARRPKLATGGDYFDKDLWGNGLLGIIPYAKGRIEMGLDAQSVRSIGDRSEAARLDVAGMTNAVRRVHHHGQPTLALDQRRYGFIGMITISIEGRGRPTGTQHDVWIPAGDKVFRRRQKLLVFLSS